jgi:hypothetical protein
VVAQEGRHRIDDVLSLAVALDIPPMREVVCPAGTVRAEYMPKDPYAVIHAGPKFRDTRWTEEGWRGLAAALAGRGLTVVATGGPTPEDRSYQDGVWAGRPEVRRLDGLLTWPELAQLIRAAGDLAATGAPRSRSMDQPTRAFGALGPSADLSGRGLRPARRSVVAMYGLSRIRYRASPARRKAANTASTAIVAVSTNSRCSRWVAAVEQALASRPLADDHRHADANKPI